MKTAVKLCRNTLQIMKLKKEIVTLKQKLLLVSMLTADTPQFFNPMVVMEAKRIRDEVLANREDYQ